MESLGLHPGLENRLKFLEERIWETKRKANVAADLEKIDLQTKAEALEKRLKAFEKRLQALNREGAGLFTRMKAGMTLIGFDVTASFENFVERLDSRYRAARR